MTDVVKNYGRFGRFAMHRCQGHAVTHVDFSVALLRQVMPRLRGDCRTTAEGLMKSSLCLKEWYDLVNEARHALPKVNCQRALDLARKHITLWKAHTDSTPKPKHHAFADMSRQLPLFGNPFKYSTYIDESFNSLVSRLARSVHPAKFAVSILKILSATNVERLALLKNYMSMSSYFLTWRIALNGGMCKALHGLESPVRSCA